MIRSVFRELNRLRVFLGQSVTHDNNVGVKSLSPRLTHSSYVFRFLRLSPTRPIDDDTSFGEVLNEHILLVVKKHESLRLPVLKSVPEVS